MSKKINVGLLFGGRSCEHQVSVTSARSVLAAIDQKQFQPILIGIDLDGGWHYSPNASIDSLVEDGTVVKDQGELVTLDFAQAGRLLAVNQSGLELPVIDVFFPVLHGTFGEDGTVQGLLEMTDIAYVGCGVAASANGMDKIISKQLFKLAGIPMNQHVLVPYHRWKTEQAKIVQQVCAELSFPSSSVFVKPVSLGSSVGISKAIDEQSLIEAIDKALLYDNKIMVEVAYEAAHEVECAVLGNEQAEASVVGEIDAGAEFYDYDAKYIDDCSEVIIPAPISPEAASEVRKLALRAFKAIDGSGLARVDFFVSKTPDSEPQSRPEVVINEINTLPGFTPISMYPKLWNASGLPYSQLIATLISLAVERHADKQRLKRAY